MCNPLSHPGAPCVYLFEGLPHHVTFSPGTYEDSNLSTSRPTLICCFVTVTAILVGVKWCLVVLICTSLVMNDVERLFMCFFGEMSTQVICTFFFLRESKYELGEGQREGGREEERENES